MSFPFPNLIPGGNRLPPNFELWPDLAQFPEFQATLPNTPPIPPVVQTGDVITSGHENQVTTALNDLWVNEQWLAARMIQDPTTTKGDLIVRDATAPARFPVGVVNGNALLVDNSTAHGLRWGAITAAGVGAVPVTRQVIAGAGLSGGGPLSADVTLTANVTSVFGRGSAVVATAGDYTAAMVTNAVSTLGAYADPAWITALAWGKLTGVPGSFAPAPHVHPAADITSGVMALARLGTGTPDSTKFLCGDGVWTVPPLPAHVHAAADITSGVMALARLGTGAPTAAMFLRGDGVWALPPGSAGGGQTPWFGDVDAAAHALNFASGIGINVAAVGGVGLYVQSDPYATAFAQAFFRNFSGETLIVSVNGTGNSDATLDRAAQINSTNAALVIGNSTAQFRLVAGGDLAYGDIVGGWKERVRFTKSGYVGIGNPLAALPNANASVHLVVGGLTGTWGDITAATDTAVIGGLVGRLNFANYNLATPDKRIAAILGFTDIALNSGALAFFTWNTGVASERMRINKDGNVGVGTSNIGARLQILTDVLGATGLACAGGAPNIYLAAVAGAPNPGSNAAQTDAVLFAMATATGNYGLAQGDLMIATQTRVGTAGGNRIILAHPADSAGGYAPGFYYDRGTVGINGVCAAGAKFTVNGGRTLLIDATQPYSLGLKNSAAGTVVWQGADAAGNWILSGAGGSEIARISTAGALTVSNVSTGTINCSSNAIVSGWLSADGRTIARSNVISSLFNATAIEVNQTNLKAFGTWPVGDTEQMYSPRISFHWTGKIASQIGMDGDGRIRTYDNPGTGYEHFAAASITANGNALVTGDLTVNASILTGTHITAYGVVQSASALKTGVLDGSAVYTLARNGGDGYLYTDGTQAGATGYIWRVDSTREVMRIWNSGNVSIGIPTNVLPLHVRVDARGASPVLGSAYQPGGHFRFQTHNVGCDFGLFPNGDTWIQAYNGINTQATAYGIAINPLGAPGSISLGKGLSYTSLLSIGALPSASTGVPGDIWRDSSGYLRMV